MIQTRRRSQNDVCDLQNDEQIQNDVNLDCQDVPLERILNQVLYLFKEILHGQQEYYLERIVRTNPLNIFLTSHWHDVCSPQQELSLNKNVVNNQTERRKPLEVKGDRNGESASRAKRAESP